MEIFLKARRNEEIKGTRKLIKFYQSLKGISTTNVPLQFTKSYRLKPAYLVIQNHLSLNRSFTIKKILITVFSIWCYATMAIAPFLPLRWTVKQKLLIITDWWGTVKWSDWSRINFSLQTGSPVWWPVKELADTYLPCQSQGRRAGMRAEVFYSSLLFGQKRGIEHLRNNRNK